MNLPLSLLGSPSRRTTATVETGNFITGAVTHTTYDTATVTDADTESDSSLTDATTPTVTETDTGTITGNYFTGYKKTQDCYARIGAGHELQSFHGPLGSGLIKEFRDSQWALWAASLERRSASRHTGTSGE